MQTPTATTNRISGVVAGNWQQQLTDTLAEPNSDALWQLLQEFREHLLHAPASWYACVQLALAPPSTQSTKPFIAVPFIAVLQVLRLSLVLRFQPSVQLSLMAACATHRLAIKAPTNSVWYELQQQLRKPVLQQSELTRLAAFALHTSTGLNEGRSERHSWQQWLLKHPCGASWHWCTQLIQQSRAHPLADPELIPERDADWYGTPVTDAQNPAVQAQLQRQQAFMGAVLDNYRRSLKLQAPRKLLQALRDYAAGNGQLTPLVTAINRRPGLVTALLSEASQDRPHAAAPAIKQRILWLGPKRVATIVANTLLHEQLTNYRSPYHHQLVAYNLVFQQLLRVFLANSKATAQLKMPVPLFALVWNAGLFRHNKQHALMRLTVPNSIPGWHSCYWFQPANSAASYQQLSEQVATRWQLPTAAISQVNIEHINNNISACMVLASAGVWACFAPASKPSEAAGKSFTDALKQLNIKQNLWIQKVSQVAAKHSAQCQWPRF